VIGSSHIAIEKIECVYSTKPIPTSIVCKLEREDKQYGITF
jgi:hypothetical protein